MVAAVAFVGGWLLALASLCRARPRMNRGELGVPIAVVVPARNEGPNVVELLRSLRREPGVEVVVVDDHSRDDTARLARSEGTTVVHAPDVPPGWTGKCWACHVGASATHAELLAFVDADVRLAPGALAALASAAATHDALVSVQPWHDAGPGFEQLSMIPNLAALMGSGAFAFPRSHRKLAFGPVLVTTRAGYRRSGGFEAVRGETVEDVALARRYERVSVLTGRRVATFRMHRNVHEFVNGWTRVLRRGAGAGSPFGVASVTVWIAALSAGLTSPWLYGLDAIGLAVLSRVAGRFRWYTALLYPAGLLAFGFLCVRSLVSRRVTWRDRELPR